jgi:hypothetical protein
MTPTKNPNVMNILNGYSAKRKFACDESNTNSKLTGKTLCAAIRSECSDDNDEKFIQPPLDTFNDLFENGKMSEMLLNKNVMFMPFLPSGSIIQHEKKRLSALHSFDESEWNQQLNMWKNSIANEIQVECTDLCSDMPKAEDLIFKIPDNFDLI